MVQKHVEFKQGEPIPLTNSQLKVIFNQWDTNKDGLLDQEELKKAFEHLGAHFPKWRAGRALTIADEDRDGYISQKELDALVKYAIQKGYQVK